jgi:glycosyltransferase involved in cell wall biosynthesis
MRILSVVDVYPPARTGGATLYTVQLAEQLVRMGVAVDVACAGAWEEGPAHFNGITQDERNGVTVHRIQLNWRKAPAPFDYLYDNQTLAPIFRDLLVQVRPDVVHMHSCLTLSARIIQEAQSLGIPVVLHLHQFWFLCALQNLVRKDGSVCRGPESPWGCQSCVLDGTKALRWSGRFFPGPLQEKLLSNAGRRPWITRQPGLIGMLGDMARRHAYLRQTLASVDVAVSPAHSLIDLFARNGFRTDHMVYSLQGFDVAWAADVQRHPSDRIRFGYIGHIQQIKGVHTLVEAFCRLPGGVAASLSIYGDPAQQPDYAEALRSRSTPNIHWQGPFERDQLASVLSDLDVVVVPSLSFEVNPTVIKEAFAAGIPVIVSDQPGVCETVEHGVSGLHFRTDDADDLRSQISRVVEESGLLQQLRLGIPAVKTISQSAREMLTIYRGLPASNTCLDSLPLQ